MHYPPLLFLLLSPMLSSVTRAFLLPSPSSALFPASRLFSSSRPHPLSPVLAKLDAKAAALSQELSRVLENQQSTSLADLLISSLHLIPPNPSLYKLSLPDYTCSPPATVDVALPDKSPGGREGARLHAESLYLSSRKGRRGEGVLRDLLSRTEAARSRVERVEATDGEKVSADDWKRVQRLCKNLVKVGPPPPPASSGGAISEPVPKPARKAPPASATYRSFDFPPAPAPPSFRVFLGRNKRQNEALSFKLARDGDLWMHARGSPGAHVLLRALDRKLVWGKGGGGEREMREEWGEALEFAADLAAFYSDLREERKAEITVAEPKHVQKPPKAPLGAVKVRQELFTIVGDPFRVPEICREKRDEGAGKKRGKRS